MNAVGFEPTKLAYRILSPAPLTARKHIHIHFSQKWSKTHSTFGKVENPSMAGIEPAISRLEVGRDIHFATRTNYPHPVLDGGRTHNLSFRRRTRYPITLRGQKFLVKELVPPFLKRWRKGPTETRTQVTGVKTLCDNHLHY